MIKPYITKKTQISGTNGLSKKISVDTWSLYPLHKIINLYTDSGFIQKVSTNISFNVGKTMP